MLPLLLAVELFRYNLRLVICWKNRSENLYQILLQEWNRVQYFLLEMLNVSLSESPKTKIRVQVLDYKQTLLREDVAEVLQNEVNNKLEPLKLKLTKAQLSQWMHPQSPRPKPSRQIRSNYSSVKYTVNSCLKIKRSLRSTT